MEQTAASTPTRPSLRRLPGIHAVATYSPGGDSPCQRASTSIALHATRPPAPTLEHRHPERHPPRPPDVDVVDSLPLCIDDPNRPEAHEVVTRSLLFRPR